MDPEFVYIFSPIAILGGVGLFLWGRNTYKKYRLIKDIPRSVIRSLAMGLVEIHGHVKAIELLVAPFSKTECVYYRYIIDELKRHKKGTRWRTVARGTQEVRFLAEDETGVVTVDPTDADYNVEIRKEYRHKAGLFGGFSRMIESLSRWTSGEIADHSAIPMHELDEVDPNKLMKFYSVGDRRYREYFLSPGDTLFLMGTAAHDSNEKSHVIVRKGENSPVFIIADRDESHMLKTLRGRFLLGTILGICAVALGLFVVLKSMGEI